MNDSDKNIYSLVSDFESFHRSHSDAYGKLLWRTLQRSIDGNSCRGGIC